MIKRFPVKIEDIQYIRDEELNSKIISFFNMENLKESELLEFIKDPDIKRGIICEFTPGEFMILDNMNYHMFNDIYKALFDEEGIKLLYTSNHASRIIEILVRSTFNEYFYNDESFCLAALKLSKNYEYLFYRAYLCHKSIFFDVLLKNAKDYKYKILDNFAKLFSKEQIKIIDAAELSNAEICGHLSTLHNETVLWLMNNNRFDISFLSQKDLISLLARSISIPQYIIDNPTFVKELTSSIDVLSYRKIVEYMTEEDTTNINNKRKDFYDKQIYSYDKENDMLNMFSDIYEKLKMNDNSFFLIQETNKYDSIYRKRIFDRLNRNISLDFKKGILKDESRKQLSNMIIDYHFEEYPYNIFLDIKELILFQSKTDKKIPEERINVYKRILKLDFLSYDEAIKLHEELKTMNIKEIFYDDMLFARNIVGEIIKDKMLTLDKLSKYINKEKSEELGVNVYELNGEEFFALVKSGAHFRHDYPFGYSFSLVGKNAIGVYGDIYTGDTFVYGGLTKEQIVHIYPTDSYTHYEEDRNSSRRVNILMEPKELLDSTYAYNELLIKEKGKEETDMDSKIPELYKIAVYCFDNVTEDQLEAAKEEGVGLLLIKTRNYTRSYNDDNRDFIRGFAMGDYNYYKGNERRIVELERTRERMTRL